MLEFIYESFFRVVLIRSSIWRLFYRMDTSINNILFGFSLCLFFFSRKLELSKMEYFVFSYTIPGQRKRFPILPNYF